MPFSTRRRPCSTSTQRLTHIDSRVEVDAKLRFGRLTDSRMKAAFLRKGR